MKLLSLAVVAWLAVSLPAAVADAPRGFAMERVALYQPEEVLDARVGVADLAAYIKQLQAVCAGFFATAGTPETLHVVVAVRPGKRARIWFASSTRLDLDPARDPLRKQLAAVPPCEVRGGPVAFALSGKIAGGGASNPPGDQGFALPVPQAWKDASKGKEGVVVPDGLLDLVWPDAAASTAGIVPANRPADSPAARPVVYHRVTAKDDPRDRAERDAYGSKFTVIELADGRAYTPPQPIDGRLPKLARAASGEVLSGDVLVAYIVTPDGRAIEPVVLHSTDARLDATALKATESWRFEAARLHGAPVATVSAQQFTFRRP